MRLGHSHRHQCQGPPQALSQQNQLFNRLKEKKMKSKLYFAAEVAAVLIAIALLQSKVMNVPVVGEFLPGYTPRA
jgi:hypothetical protein